MERWLKKMLLNQLFEDAPSIEIQQLMIDSRQKCKDAIFFCLKGLENDGHHYIDMAIQNGAKVIVYSDDITKKEDVIYIKVNDVTKALNVICNKFYQYPSQKLKMYGVTGTNGKSSVTTLIRNILNPYQKCGYIGTISIEYGNVKLPPLLTTPNVVDLQYYLDAMVKDDVKACALEVSSIGIEQKRVDGIHFDVCVYTNLTHDHLDYHGTIEDYFHAKKKLFDMMHPNSYAIINIDDPYALKMVEDCHANIVTYGINHVADYQACNIQLMADKTVLTLKVNQQEYRIETNLVALFNVYNLLAAISALHKTGLSMDLIIQQLTQLKQIEGRMEKVVLGQPFNVIVDFAHTPDGIEKVMKYAQEITPKERRIIAVFGSAGKRDFKKRIMFGQLADKYCDMIILTEDDPRDEDVFQIAQEIAEGIKKKNHIIIEDRYNAIRQAIEMATANDTILILGKGDEAFIYREFGREEYRGDQNVAKDMIKRYYFKEEIN